MDDAKLNVILDRHDRDPSALLAILMDIQKEENYLPREDLGRVSERIGVPMSRIYSLATFFSAFSLKPRGKHICTVCMGTACHVRGAPKLVEQIGRDFDVKAGETTADMKLTLETVNCVGACALGPLVILDGEYHGNITPTKLERVMKNLKKEQG
ncbi:MAG: NAD(P)H-dependent oxidoreductase subunit E [Deltaproteobacteria bacterium]|nr:NAD(P)H-dependent oxidoreductase subunit E [Deltaproteobacteria bacterium]